MNTLNKILKNRSLLFSLIAVVLVVIIIVFILVNRSSNNLNNNTESSVLPSVSSCQQLCQKATSVCNSLDNSICLNMCSSWTSEQKTCVMRANSCDYLYKDCNVDENLVYEPEIQTECQTACDKYVRMCNVHDDLSKVVNDVQMFNECVSNCDSSWNDDLKSCVIDASSCSQMLNTCQ